MKKIIAWLLATMMLLSLAACNQNPPEETTAPTTTAATEPAEEMEHFDLNEIDLDGIGELFVQRGQEERCKIQLDGLCTPVVLELEGTGLVSITAYGITACVDPAAEEFACIYGNLWPVIYEHEGLILLNIWHDDIGYSCVMCPDGTYMETYPDKDYSVMIYEDEEGRLCQSQFARKFVGIEQWDTGPIDMATSRVDFYYSVDDALWTEEDYCVTARESYTISDCFELDEIFDHAKENGLYPEFETLDELLAYNAQRFSEADDSASTSSGPDSVREETGFFDQIFQCSDYDAHDNLVSDTFYDLLGGEYFKKVYTYDAKNREVSGFWSFEGAEVYRYTKTYDDQDRLIETVWYQDGKEVERFSYTYGNSSYTETFSQLGEKKYTYTFNAAGELTAHTVYQGDEAVQTKDVTKLVKAELLTDIWFPLVDSEPVHYSHYYDGTLPTENPEGWTVATAADGSCTMTYGSVDEEDGLYYATERRYDPQGRLLQVIYTLEGNEYSREDYEYSDKGCSRMTSYADGEKVYTCEYQYNDAGMLVRENTSYVNPQTYYTSVTQDGLEVEKEVTYTERAEAYRYNKNGLLVETVLYEDGKETERTAYDYDANGYVLPRLDTYLYNYNADGILEQVWLIYEDHAAGAAQLRSRTVYVTADNARQLQEIMRTELSWF